MMESAPTTHWYETRARKQAQTGRQDNNQHITAASIRVYKPELKGDSVYYLLLLLLECWCTVCFPVPAGRTSSQWLDKMCVITPWWADVLFVCLQQRQHACVSPEFREEGLGCAGDGQQHEWGWCLWGKAGRDLLRYAVLFWRPLAWNDGKQDYSVAWV